MGSGTAGGTLRAVAAIAKTTQTLMGSIIDCRGYDWLTLFFAYVKGDETGLTMIPWALDADDTAYRVPVWTATAGAYTQVASSYAFTATATGVITLDVRGLSRVKWMQGGTSNDGTPTGTLGASYVLKG